MNNTNPTNRTLLLVLELLAKNGWEPKGKELPSLELGPGEVIHPSNPRLKDNYAEVRPESIHELKLLIGVTNDCIDHSQGHISLPDVNLDELNLPNGFDYDSLDHATKSQVDDAAYRLLFGHVNEDDLSSGALQSVHTYLMDRYSVVPVLVGNDLNVPTGTTYTINTATAVFDTVTVHGTGQISFSQNCKLTANSVVYSAS